LMKRVSRLKISKPYICQREIESKREREREEA
jgi:hypothetical protein